MIRVLVMIAAFGLVTGFASLASADHHEAGEKKIDVAAPVAPDKVKADAADPIDEAVQDAEGVVDDAAKKVENAMDPKQVPAAPAKPE